VLDQLSTVKAGATDQAVMQKIARTRPDAVSIAGGALRSKLRACVLTGLLWETGAKQSHGDPGTLSDGDDAEEEVGDLVGKCVLNSRVA